ncbi:MAG: Ig-like domain repeat protein, partial [Caldilinea sp.]|nr:Ig-like domain repeat protein [Caldilinea sp.]
SATALVAAPNPSVIDQTVTFTATVTDSVGSALPTGVVTFTEGAATLSTGTLDASGIATYTTSSLTIGTHGVTASYGGDAAFTGSNSSQVDQAVTCAPTIVVANTADSGAGSLRQAVSDVCDGGVISFGVSTPATITLTSGEIAITRTVTISGPGAGDLAVSGNNASRVFNISSSGTVTLTALTVREGTAGSSGRGGGIYNLGKLTIIATHVVSNSAPNGYGGGIYSQNATSALTVTAGSLIQQNSAYAGGGIGNASATLAVDASGVISNSTTGSYGGGGIWNTGRATILNGSYVQGNSASNEGGGIYNIDGTLTLDASTVATNTAGGGSYGGGGILNVGSASRLFIINGSRIVGNYSSKGGGISNRSSLAISASTVISNSSANYGGGIYNTGSSSVITITAGSIIEGNSATLGGGIFNQEGSDITIDNSRVLSNIVDPTSGQGGGIYNNFVGSVVTITNGSLVQGNSAGSGAGIYNYLNAVLTIRESAVTSNTAVASSGGSIYNWGAATVENSTFAANRANSGSAIYSGGVLTVTNSTIANSGMTSGSGIYNSGMFYLRNSLIATGNGVECINAGTFAANINNLVADGTCSAAFSGNPLLGPLGAYGGSTQTIPLLPGSPAIDAGDAATCLATDQRGIGRVGTCDIGAFESQGFSLSKGTGDGQSAAWDMAFAASITVAVSSAYTEPVNGGRVTYAGPLSGASTAPVTGTATIMGGTAIFTPTANSTAGTYNVTTSAAGGEPAIIFALTNTMRASATTLASSANPSVYGQSVTFTATVTDSVGSAVPTGVVTFTDGTTELGTGTLNASGVATYTISSLISGPPGTPGQPHPITAEYGGEGGFVGSTSQTVNQVVNQATTTVTLTSSLNPSIYGNSVVFTATVTVEAPGAASLIGEEVIFKDGANTLSTGTLGAGGVATYTTSLLGAGVHTITADYAGTPNVLGSTSSGVVQTVNMANQTITFGELGDKQYGADAFPVTATASSGLTAVFTTTTTSVCTVSGTTVSLVDNGSCTIYASQPGNENYLAATPVDRSFNLTCAESVVVNTPADSGYRTLRGAVANLCAGGTVTFDAALDNQTIALSSGQIAITKTVTIDGPGAAKLAVSGSNASRVFDIGASGVVTLTALTVRDGSAADVGGGIRNNGRLTLSAAAIVSNTAGTYGGGIGNGTGAAVTITASTIATNTAVYGGGGVSTGIGGVTTISSSTLTANAIATTESVTSGGGAIFGANGSMLTVSDSTLSFNRASGSEGGGAIDANGPLTITGSSFISNTAATYGASEGQGGAVSFGGNNLYTAVISGTTFLSNTAYNRGGALYVGNGTLDLDASTLSGNTAAGFGEMGGALYCDDCDFTIDGATFSGNSAYSGGGIYVTATSLTTDDAITSSTLQENRADADSGLGGALYVGDNYRVVISDTAVVSNSAYGGGGAFAVAGAQLTLERSRLDGNTATAQGGGIFNAGTLSVKNSTATGNDATGGGAIYDVSWLSVSASSFFSNTAKNGGAITVDQENTNAYIGSSVFGGNSSDCNGGALAAAAPVTVERSELYGNQAGLACSELALGGAIYVENALWLTVSAVHDNVSAVAGGAIGILGNLNSPKTVEIRGSALYSNSATMAGAVAIGGPSVT